MFWLYTENTFQPLLSSFLCGSYVMLNNLPYALNKKHNTYFIGFIPSNYLIDRVGLKERKIHCLSFIIWSIIMMPTYDLHSYWSLGLITKIALNLTFSLLKIIHNPWSVLPTQQVFIYLFFLKKLFDSALLKSTNSILKKW